jgi:hypothetical protein
MAKLWSTVKNLYLSPQAKTPRQKTPRMATLAMEVLAENREEAKDLVYYDALKRVTESSKVCIKCIAIINIIVVFCSVSFRILYS